VGEFNGGKKGKGIINFPDGKKYEGTFNNHGMDGDGTLNWPNGDKYVGKFGSGRIHGRGILTYNDGGMYEGEWKNYKMWNGTELDLNGNITGKYVNGVKQE
jgi:hypothetical protein